MTATAAPFAAAPFAATPAGREPIPGTLLLIDWIIKDRERLRDALHDDRAHPELLPRLLSIAVGALAIYGTIMAGVVAVTHTPLAGIIGHRAPISPFAIPIAYPLGLLGALGICLPSFWFYALQCGFRPSLRQIVLSTAVGQALTGVFLIGILPVFAAGIIAAERLGGGPDALRLWAWLGLVLPLPAGIIGVRELHGWFIRAAETLPKDRRASRRGFVELLALWSAALYVTVAPLLVLRLLEVLG